MPVDKKLWPDWTDQRRLAHMYAMRCLSHRVRKFGFEELLNKLDSKSLVAFSTFAHEPLATACIREALRMDPLALKNIDV